MSIWPVAALAPLALAITPACVTSMSLRELDRLNRSVGVQTIAVRDTHTVYSPYEWVATRDFADLVGVELEAVEELLDQRATRPVPILLRAAKGVRPLVSMVDGVVSVEPAREHPHHGVEGYASAEFVVVYVEETTFFQSADGRVIPGQWSAESYRATIRHELVHALEFQAGITRGDWFDEGLPEVVETLSLEDGRLVESSAPERIAPCAAIPRAERSLRELLAWEQDAVKVHEGRERVNVRARILAQCFVRFLLQRDPSRSFAERVRWITDLERDDLLALEPEWQEWIDARGGWGAP